MVVPPQGVCVWWGWEGRNHKTTPPTLLFLPVPNVAGWCAMARLSHAVLFAIFTKLPRESTYHILRGGRGVGNTKKNTSVA